MINQRVIRLVNGKTVFPDGLAFCSWYFSRIWLLQLSIFIPPEDTHEGIRKITVEGPSPVGFRSLIGNDFFSTDNTIWHKGRKFIMRVLILPLPFLVPALFVEYLLYQTVLSWETSVNKITFISAI